MSESSIVVDPAILGGKPVVRGSRISVELLLRKLSEGASVADLLVLYPRLTEADVHAAIAYAADTIAIEETIDATLSSDEEDA